MVSKLFQSPSSAAVGSVIRRALLWIASGVTAAIVLIAVLSTALDAGYLRQPFIRFLAAHTGRKIQIGGVLETHFFSITPRVIAEQVTIGNPPWTPPGTTAEIEKIALIFQLPWIGRSFGIQRLEMHAATLHLMRDAAGHANWQRTDPDKGPEDSLPIIRSLSMRSAHVVLDDARRHLRFDGMVTAEDEKGSAKLQPLRIEGTGALNGREAAFEITGDPLATADHQRAYHFTYSEHSSGSRLTGSGLLLRPFEFDSLDTTFEAAGADLKDIFFLTGVTLVDTGSYRFSGKLARRGTHSEFSDLVVTSGQSDVRGSVSIESAHGRPHFQAHITSQLLRLSDLGKRAAGREPAADADTLLLSNAMLSPKEVRRGDWVVHYRAREVDVGRVPLHQVSAKMTVDHGILVVAPLLADVLGGTLNVHLKTDARTDIPTSDVDLKLSDAQLEQFYHKTGPPLVAGSLQARVSVAGQGRSVHEVAASANGTVTGVVTHGTIRSSLAELTGIDLRALGLILTNNKEQTGMRCVVASFLARDGTLNAQRLVADTDPVLITGEGQLHLDSESLDFALRGHPKSFRLFRLHAPLWVRGTIIHPTIGIQVRNKDDQSETGEAVGAATMPLPAVLSFVDPGLAKDENCASLQQPASVAVN
jgi:AsmA family protein